MYEYLAMVSDESDASLEGLKEKLEKFYAKDKRKVAFFLTEKNLHLTFPTFTFYIEWNKEDYVVIESQEMADNCDRADKAILASCKKRFEISDTNNDDDMDYFNDSLYIIEAIAEFKGVFILNPQDGLFFDEY